jgi:hypothetical protein
MADSTHKLSTTAFLLGGFGSDAEAAFHLGNCWDNARFDGSLYRPKIDEFLNIDTSGAHGATTELHDYIEELYDRRCSPSTFNKV